MGASSPVAPCKQPRAPSRWKGEQRPVRTPRRRRPAPYATLPPARASTPAVDRRRPGGPTRAHSAIRKMVRNDTAANPLPRPQSGPSSPEASSRLAATPTWLDGTTTLTGARGSPALALRMAALRDCAAGRPNGTHSKRSVTARPGPGARARAGGPHLGATLASLSLSVPRAVSLLNNRAFTSTFLVVEPDHRPWSGAEAMAVSRATDAERPGTDPHGLKPPRSPAEPGAGKGRSLGRSRSGARPSGLPGRSPLALHGAGGENWSQLGEHLAPVPFDGAWVRNNFVLVWRR